MEIPRSFIDELERTIISFHQDEIRRYRFLQRSQLKTKLKGIDFEKVVCNAWLAAREGRTFSDWDPASQRAGVDVVLREDDGKAHAVSIKSGNYIKVQKGKKKVYKINGYRVGSYGTLEDKIEHLKKEDGKVDCYLCLTNRVHNGSITYILYLIEGKINYDNFLWTKKRTIQTSKKTGKTKEIVNDLGIQEGIQIEIESSRNLSIHYFDLDKLRTIHTFTVD